MKRNCWLSLCLISITGCWLTGAQITTPPIEQEGPRLEIVDFIDLGEVKQGEVAEHLVKFSNVGTKELRIDEVETSCGCTAVILTSRVLAPGEVGELKVALDTIGKKGRIVKTITILSNDYLAPEKSIQMVTQVKAPLHPQFDMGETLFSSRCRSCHADKGKGLIGASLYLAICYQCHGMEGEGGSATALSDQDYLNAVDREYLYRWIAQGKQGTAMPGYSQQHGGPLTEQQINSLAEFILEWR